MSSQAHEDKCERCGVSCHFTAIEGSAQVAIWGMHCKFLQMEGKRAACSVYPKRFEVAPWCHHSSEAAKGGMLRIGCPYGTLPAGKTALRGEEYDAVWPSILEKVRCNVWPHWVNPDAFLAELRKREPDTEWEYVNRSEGYVFQPKGCPPPVLIVWR